MPWRHAQCVIKHYVMKMYGGVEVQLHAFSGQLHDPATLPTGTHWRGHWVGPRTSLDAVAKRKKSLPLPGTNPCHPVHSSVIMLTELPWTLILFSTFKSSLYIVVVMNFMCSTSNNTYNSAAMATSLLQNKSKSSSDKNLYQLVDQSVP